MANEMTPEQEREVLRKAAMVRLKNKTFSGYTAAKLGSWEQYGGLLEDMYKSTASGNPDKLAYDYLIKRRLLAGEAVAKDTLLNDATSIMQSSLGDITVTDLYELMGIKRDVQEGYANKLVSELEDDQKKAVYGGFFGNLTDNHAKNVLGGRVKGRKNKLEKMFGVPDKE
jgi:hypothetical protein